MEICREIGNSRCASAIRQARSDAGQFERCRTRKLRSGCRRVVLAWTCTAKMGRDDMSVVDGRLKVYGIDGLRVADGSIMPRVTTGNTMAPCVIIGERAADILKSEHTF